MKNKECDNMAKLTTMINIGKEMEMKLNAVNISTAEELIQIGSKEAFFRLNLQYSNICLVHLYTLQGAIDNIEYNLLSDEVKANLKSFNDELK